MKQIENGTKEFQEMMNTFERHAKSLVNIGSMGLTKEPKELWKKGSIYCDGNVNNAFKMFSFGVNYGIMESNLNNN